MRKNRGLGQRPLILLGAAGVLAAGGAAVAQPANDLCGSAQTVTASSSTMGTNVAATSDVAFTSCAFTPTDDKDVWYDFTPPFNGSYVIDTFGPGTLGDTTLSVWSGCGGTELFCNDDSGTLRSSVLALNLTASTLYKIRVAGWNGGTGTFPLNISGVTIVGMGGTDDCPGATVVTAGSITLGNTLSATSDIPESSCSFGDSADVWFSFTPPSTAYYTISTNGSTDFDTTLQVYSACGGTELVCDDDAGTGLLSLVNPLLNAGTNYRIRIAGYNGELGNFQLNVGNPVPPPTAPANDNCASAIIIPSLPYQNMQDIAGATDDADLASCNAAAATTIPNGVWYQYTPASNQRVQIVENSILNTFFVVLEAPGGCSGSLTEVAGSCGFNVLLDLNAGTTYFILVGCAAATPLGPPAVIDLTLEEIVPPSNDTCGTATSISGNYSATFDTTGATNENAEPSGSCNATGAAGLDNSVWFTFTPGSNGSLSGTLDGDYDMIAVLFTGSCGSLTEVACYDEPEPIDLAAPQSGSAAVSAGTQYWLAIGDWGVADGGGTTMLNINIPAGAGGACCVGATCVAAAGAGACTGANTAYAGDGTVCNAFGGNNTTPCCLADFNHVGGVGVQDIFDFLAAYFNNNASADINGGGLGVQDIFDFLSVYFSGCP